jgi:hypothetical protein
VAAPAAAAAAAAADYSDLSGNKEHENDDAHTKHKGSRTPSRGVGGPVPVYQIDDEQEEDATTDVQSGVNGMVRVTFDDEEES